MVDTPERKVNLSTTFIPADAAVFEVLHPSIFTKVVYEVAVTAAVAG
jgi:hypothetical protein